MIVYYCFNISRSARVVRFYVRCAAPPASCHHSFLLAGPPLPALDRSGPRRTSTASSRSQWPLPDLHCQLSITVGLAGPPTARARSLWASPDVHRRESERCGPRWTSTGESLSAVGLAGLQPARV